MRRPDCRGRADRGTGIVQSPFAALREETALAAPSLLTLAHRLTGERADAEDVVQDVFVGLPEAMRRYEDRGAFGAWLRRVTVRHALMRQRRAKGRREEPHGLESEMLPARAEPSSDVHELVERAVRALPEPQRHVFVLRIVEGYSHAEIARLLNSKVGTSEVRLSRALKVLRGLLGDLR